MPVKANKSDDGKKLTIAVSGYFDFGVQKDFRNSYENSSASVFVVDMKETEHLDSSALGMLLMMREYAGGNHANITLRNCSQEIKTILSVASFQSLFNIE
ncbi:MAG: STAS domain-containing protein [Gammaproteobacteria bacterium]|nr:STAS domain-containing protein [Gammaproteobacteria bacterium]